MRKIQPPDECRKHILEDAFVWGLCYNLRQSVRFLFEKKRNGRRQMEKEWKR